MIDEALMKLIEFLESVSPQVWQSLIKQVYVEAFSKLAWGTIWVFVAFTAFRMLKLQEAKYNEEWDDGKFITDSNWAGLYAVIAVTGLFAAYLFISAAMWFINPEFYAIRFLLDKLGG